MRKKISERFAYLYDNMNKIVQIQAWWRSMVQRKKYIKLLEKRTCNGEKSKIQYLKVKARYLNILDHYREHVNNTHLFYSKLFSEIISDISVYCMYYFLYILLGGKDYKATSFVARSCRKTSFPFVVIYGKNTIPCGPSFFRNFKLQRGGL